MTNGRNSTLSLSEFKQAEEAIKRKFASEGFRGELRYDAARVIENERWWYIPCGWIGCFGCIVNKSDHYVNWLGSSSMSMDDVFWGHDHGLYCDLVDFTFVPKSSLGLVAQLLPKFMHMHPNARGKLPVRPVWYRDSEVADAISAQFPCFKRHYVWYAIPELRKASERDELQFSATLSVAH